MDHKITTKSRLKKTIRRLKAKGRRVVFTNGCFDILHLGHIKYLARAKKQGDALVVAVNTDNSVRKIKGRERPLVPQNERIQIVAALESVDFVVLFNEPTPGKIIKYLEPDILVKGSDYKLADIVGKDTVTGYGGEVRTIPLVKGKSTSGIIRKIRNRHRVKDGR